METGSRASVPSFSRVLHACRSRAVTGGPIRTGHWPATDSMLGSGASSKVRDQHGSLADHLARRFFSTM